MARLLTPEQHQFLENNVKGMGNQELTNLINDKFETDFTRQQIKTYKKNHNLSSGLTGHFPKGHVPINKGIKECLTLEEIRLLSKREQYRQI